MNRADGDRRVGQTIKARRELATQRVGGRAWLNGRELGVSDPSAIDPGGDDRGLHVSLHRLGGSGEPTAETPRFVAGIGVRLWSWPCGQQFRPPESKGS